jgi:hypothetical protein
LKCAPVSYPDTTAPVKTPRTATKLFPALKLIVISRIAVPTASSRPIINNYLGVLQSGSI